MNGIKLDRTETDRARARTMFSCNLSAQLIALDWQVWFILADYISVIVWKSKCSFFVCKSFRKSEWATERAIGVCVFVCFAVCDVLSKYALRAIGWHTFAHRLFRVVPFFRSRRTCFFQYELATKFGHKIGFYCRASVDTFILLCFTFKRTFTTMAQ